MEPKNAKKVLIVEDDEDYLWLLRQGFDNQGFSMVYAQDGLAGLQMAQREKPDLIMIDILLPKMDGIAMAKKIKEQGIASQMVFLTNFKDGKHITDAIEVAGEAGYIVKSDMHVDQIVAKIKNMLGVT